MEIHYLRSENSPSNGDLKILKNGKKFFRKQVRTFYGGYVVCNGRPVYEWLNYDDELVSRYKEEFELKGYKIFSSCSNKKKIKTKRITLDFSKQSDRERYTKLTGLSVSPNTTIKHCTLNVLV